MSNRLKISIELSDRLLFESDRTCCICNVANKPVQIHHMDADSSNNTYENLIVLCIECHSKAHITGGFGRELSAGQMRRYKEDWINRVKSRKEEADKLASIYTVTGQRHIISTQDDDIEYKTAEDAYLLKIYLEKIVLIHKGQLLIAQAHWNAGPTIEMIHGCSKMIDFYEAVLIELSTFYPKGTFEEKDPRKFFSEQIALRTSFHISIAEPYGPGSTGSIGRVSISHRIMEDIKQMVLVMAEQLIDTSIQTDFTGFENWGKEWMGSHEK